MTPFSCVLLALAYLLAMPPRALASTYVVPLPVARTYVGTYPVPPDYRFDMVDLGGVFRVITSVTMHWSGRIGHGSSYEHSMPASGQSLPHGGLFEAYISRNPGHMTSTPSWIDAAFDHYTYFSNSQSWADLYSGTVNVRVGFWEDPHSSAVLENCTAELYSAELIIDGELVPEPSSLLALAAYLAPFVGLAMRRRK